MRLLLHRIRREKMNRSYLNDRIPDETLEDVFKRVAGKDYKKADLRKQVNDIKDQIRKGK
jgi:hypothetical protein